MNLGQNCDLCWDEGQQDVPAFSIVAGVPLCNLHREEFSRMNVKNKPEEEFVQQPEEEDMPTAPPVIPANRKSIRKSSVVAARGVRTAKDFAELMTALMDDLLAGSVDMGTASAVCSAGDRLLRVAEMQLRYQPRGNKVLLLGAPQESPASDPRFGPQPVTQDRR